MLNIDYSRGTLTLGNKELFLNLSGLEVLDEKKFKGRHDLFELEKSFIPEIDGLFESYIAQLHCNQNRRIVQYIEEQLSWSFRAFANLKKNSPLDLLVILNRTCTGFNSTVATDAYLQALRNIFNKICDNEEKGTEVVLAILMRVIKVMGSVYSLPQIPISHEYNPIDPCLMIVKCIIKIFPEAEYSKNVIYLEIVKWQTPGYLLLSEEMANTWNYSNQRRRFQCFRLEGLEKGKR